jgi:Copper binding periplasmic protein CusF
MACRPSAWWRASAWSRASVRSCRRQSGITLRARLSHANAQLVVNHGEIPGFMGAMTLGYAVRDRRALAGLSPGDEITADVVVQGDHSWLENIVVVKKASSPPQTPEVVQPPAKRNLR